MPSSRLVAIVTALVLVGGTHGSRAEFTLEQLLVIEEYIQSRNTLGLLGYLKTNPNLLEGEDPLAVELQAFVEDMEDDLINNLSAASVGSSGGQSGPDAPDAPSGGFGSFLEGAFAQPY